MRCGSSLVLPLCKSSLIDLPGQTGVFNDPISGMTRHPSPRRAGPRARSIDAEYGNNVTLCPRPNSPIAPTDKGRAARYAVHKTIVPASAVLRAEHATFGTSTESRSTACRRWTILRHRRPAMNAGRVALPATYLVLHRGVRVAAAGASRAVHAIAMHGEPALPDGFSALPYADPDAPKGGRLVEGVLGTFDSLNPLIVQGLAAAADPRLRGREPDGARLRRAVHALRPAGAHGRDRRRPRATSLSRSIPRRIFPTARR